MLKISIPTPCHEDWNIMLPNEHGRHCNACMKTVIDFTNMTDEEVRHFLIDRKEEHMCGRFTGRQLQRIQVELPVNIFSLQMPLWKQFLVACLIVFSTTLFSCEIKPVDHKITTAQNTGEAISAVKENIIKPGIHPGYVGGLVLRYDSVYLDSTAFAVPLKDESTSVIYGGFGLSPVDTTTIETVVIPDQSKNCSKDSIPKIPDERRFKGEIKFIPDSNKVPKKMNTDSLNCNDFS